MGKMRCRAVDDCHHLLRADPIERRSIGACICNDRRSPAGVRANFGRSEIVHGIVVRMVLSIRSPNPVLRIPLPIGERHIGAQGGATC